MEKFNFVDRKVLYDSLAVNENLEVKQIKYGDFSYTLVDNFFKNPNKAINFLKNYPALNGGVSTPGARQNFTPMDLVPVLQAYQSIMDTVGQKIDPTSFITCSNIAWKGVEVMHGCMYPHADYQLVCNLWLCNFEGGTSFYKYKGHLSSKDIQIPKYRKPKEPLVPWENFDGDEDWELYYTIPTKFNSVAIYDGTNFHAPYANFYDTYRYALISFYRSEKNFA
tara:strand:- start:1245 stop:1913 length:669 start_codon:yes stop_codon:yes gene_type:complete